MKRISLIIPVYNAGAFLPDFFESLENQDWENLQILFSTDGSTDNSLALLEGFAARDPRVTVVTGENRGVSSARNRALKLADGDYIGFCDADDILEPGYLRFLAEALEDSGADMVCCGFTRIYPDSGAQDGLPTAGHQRQLTDRSGMVRLMLRPDGYTTVMWNKLFRREALTDGDGSLLRFDESLHIVEDGEYILRSGVQSALFLPDRMYRYFARRSGAMYGAVTERRLTELSARKKIVALTADLEEDVQELAKMKYQKGVRDLLFHGMLDGQGQMLRPYFCEMDTWKASLFSSPAVSRKEKIKYRVYRPLIQLNLRRLGGFLMQKLSGH